MTVIAEASRVIAATTQEVLEFVMDLERYKKADDKIGRVIQPIVLGDDDVGTAKYWGRMRGTPPAPDANIVRVNRWTDLTFIGAPRQPGRLVFSFTGRFACTEVDEGCRLTHGYELDFHRPFSWLYDRLLDPWLQDELEIELDRVQAILGGDV